MVDSAKQLNILKQLVEFRRHIRARYQVTATLASQASIITTSRGSSLQGEGSKPKTQGKHQPASRSHRRRK